MSEPVNDNRTTIQEAEADALALMASMNGRWTPVRKWIAGRLKRVVLASQQNHPNSDRGSSG